MLLSKSSNLLKKNQDNVAVFVVATRSITMTMITYRKTQIEITINEVQKAVKALIKAYYLLDGHGAINENDTARLNTIIETCQDFLYTKAVACAKEKYLHGKPLC